MYGKSDRDALKVKIHVISLAWPIWEGQNIWGWPQCFILSEQHYFVWDTASQSTKWLYMLKILGGHGPLSPLSTPLWPMAPQNRNNALASAFSLPGSFCTRCVYMPSSARHAWILAILIFPRQLLSNMNANHRWSVIRVNGLLYRKWLHFLTAGLSFWLRVAAMTKLDASLSTMKD